MPYRYSSSSDSKYFLVFEEQSISCFHGENSLWKTEFREGNISFASISVLGSIFIETQEGDAFIVRQGSHGVIEKIELPQPDLLKKSSLCKYFHMSESGKTLFYMKKNIKSGGNFFSLSKEGACEFELMTLDLRTLRPKVFYKHTVPESLEQSFLWNVSSDGSHFIITCPKKTGKSLVTEIRLIDMESSKILRTLRLTDTQITEMIVHRSGVSLLKLVQGNAESFSVMSKEGDIFNLTYEPGKNFFYLARGFVMFENKTLSKGHILTAQSFNGQHLATYNMDMFTQKNVDFALLFNARDLLSLVYIYEGKFYAFSAELLTLTTELKRFEIISSKNSLQVNRNNEDYDYYSDHYGFADTDNQTTSSAVAKEVKILSEVKTSDSNLNKKIDNISHVIPIKTAEKAQKSEAIVLDKQAKLDNKDQSVLTKKGAITKKATSKKSDENSDDDIKTTNAGNDSILQIKEELSAIPVKIQEPAKEISIAPPSAFELPLNQKEPEASVKIQSATTSSNGAADSPVSSEIRKLERLLESIEDRFLLGEINESSYKDLKLKYQRQLQAKKSKL